MSLASRSSRTTTRDSFAAVAAAKAALNDALATVHEVDLSWLQVSDATADWGLPCESLQFLSRLIHVFRPRHILEFGSGLSTEVMARAAATLRSACVISSVDHDPEFGTKTQRRLASRSRMQTRRVRCQIASLVARNYAGVTLPTFLCRPREFASRRPADLVMIDGPPRTLGGREGVLYQAMDYVRTGTIVLVDDALRAEETAVLSRWQDHLGSAVEIRVLPNFPHGLAALIVHQPIPAARLWAHRTQLVRQDIASHIPRDARFILVDQAWLDPSVTAKRRAFTFIERDGHYWGPPPDDATAIQELERLLKAGAQFVVVAWPAFWWLDHFAGLRQYLESRFPCPLRNHRVIMFDLRPPSQRT